MLGGGLTNVLGSALTSVFSDMLTGTLTGVFSDMLTGAFASVFGHMLTGTLTGVFSDMLTGAFASVFGHMLTGTLTGVFSDMLTGAFASVFGHMLTSTLTNVLADVFTNMFADVLANLLGGLVSRDGRCIVSRSDGLVGSRGGRCLRIGGGRLRCTITFGRGDRGRRVLTGDRRNQAGRADQNGHRQQRHGTYADPDLPLASASESRLFVVHDSLPK